MLSDDSFVASVSDTSISYDPVERTEPIEVVYDGEPRFTWSGVPLKVHINGERVDPHEYATADAPRIRKELGSTHKVEICLYQTQELTDNRGYAPARTVAEFVSGALTDYDISHDILHTNPPQTIPRQDAVCWDGVFDSDYDPDNENHTEMPHAYYWWTGLLRDVETEKAQNYYEETGETVEVHGDTFVQRKDSNLLITNYDNFGGCGAVNGNAAVGTGYHIDSIDEYDPGPYTSRYHGDINVCMHEIAHNFAYSHPGGCTEDAGGVAYIDDSGAHVRTPGHAGWDCENACGFQNAPAPEAGQVQKRALYYTQCSIDTVFPDSWETVWKGNSASWYTVDTAGSNTCDCPMCSAGQGECYHSPGDCDC